MSLPRCSGPRPQCSGAAREKQDEPQGAETDWPLSLTGLRTHVHFLHGGSKVCDGGGDDFLRTIAADVGVKMSGTWEKRRKKQRSGIANDQLRVDRCFYLGLDLPQVPGLVLELLPNGDICLKINQPLTDC